jgi:hypothetical protein
VALVGLLAAEKYASVTERTKMGEWRERQEREAEEAVAIGKTPRPSIFETSPSLQRMAAAIHSRIERQQKQDAADAARQAESRYWFDVNRDAIEAEHKKNAVRKIINTSRE